MAENIYIHLRLTEACPTCMHKLNEVALREALLVHYQSNHLFAADSCTGYIGGVLGKRGTKTLARPEIIY